MHICTKCGKDDCNCPSQTMSTLAEDRNEAARLGRLWIAQEGGFPAAGLWWYGDTDLVSRNISDLLDPHWWLDLRDPATQGAALDLICQRWNDPNAHLSILSHDPVRWSVVHGTPHAQVFRPHITRAGALVRALEEKA